MFRIAWGAGALAVMSALAPAAYAQDDAAVANAAIEACVRDNAAKVERAFDSLSEATTFLVASVCAKPVSDAAMIAHRDQEARRRERIEAACAAIGDDPAARFGNPMAAQCESLPFMDAYDDYESVVVYALGRGEAPPEMVGLAASLLLDARLARQSGE